MQERMQGFLKKGMGVGKEQWSKAAEREDEERRETSSICPLEEVKP